MTSQRRSLIASPKEENLAIKKGSLPRVHKLKLSSILTFRLSSIYYPTVLTLSLQLFHCRFFCRLGGCGGGAMCDAGREGG